MALSPSDPFNGGSSTASIEEIGSEDDLFSTYIDVDKLGGSGNGGSCADQGGASGNGNGADGKGENEGEKSGSGSGSGSGSRPRHRHCSSVDGSSTSTGVFGDIMEAKKAMPPDKLAELWTIDPKRAKRYVFFSCCWLMGIHTIQFGCDSLFGCRKSVGLQCDYHHLCFLSNSQFSISNAEIVNSERRKLEA